MTHEPLLICIPDISGFTKFMSEADSDFSSKIIPSLLNKIIYANDIGLRVSEIEGDAVLFYKRGALPSLKALIDQCINFYRLFYQQLNELSATFAAHKDAESLAKVLGLKIILHYGEDVDAVQIGKHIKLMGEDVVIAHKLLKNEVPKEEYLLISESLLSQYDLENLDTKVYWTELKKGQNRYEHIGKVKYFYIDLTPLI
ncbi:DUF2652 domain-containing protein [Psychroserpens sp. BH13MA-6]